MANLRDTDHEMMATTKEPLLERRNDTSKGGVKALPFIIANEAFEKVASYGLLPNMILYLMTEYGMGMSQGTNILFLWSAATNFTPIICAFLSDSYLGRFWMIGIGSVISLLGMLLLWSTTMIPGARPSCDFSNSNCHPATASQLTLLCSSFALMSIGAGGIRSSSIAFGADQILLSTQKPHSSTTSNIGRALVGRYFSWYYVSMTSSVLISLTCIVYIQDHIGWKVGFGIPVISMFFSVISFFCASPLYVKLKAKSSLLSGFAVVIKGSWKNRDLVLVDRSSYLDVESVSYHCTKGSAFHTPSEKLRFLNKACVLRSSDMTQEPTTLSSNLVMHPATVEQVEELKALIKVIPLWSTGIIACILLCQNSFGILQARSMDRHIFGTSGFEIPAGSFGTFTLITMTLWLMAYNSLIIPLASKIVGKPVCLNVKTRMGIGLFFGFLSMVVSALVESTRRARAIEEARNVQVDSNISVGTMSALWLVPQWCLFGLAEVFMAIGQTEFFYSEFPKSMSSIASTLFGLGAGVASLVASLIMTVIDRVTSQGGRTSWISSNINEAHFDYYYWVLATLSLLNGLYFTICCRAYGPCEGTTEEKVEHDGDSGGDDKEVEE